MPIPVITVAEMREWEQFTWASGQNEDAVMRRAGHSIARVVERLTRPGDRVLFLAGRGHNGDDAAYGCESLEGREKQLIRVQQPEEASKEISAGLERRPALVIDGLFGIGLNRSLSVAWTTLIERINSARCPVLAVDVPSGLNADTGLPCDTAIRASSTLTFGAVKRGLVETTAAEFVGRLEVAADIGLIPCPFVSQVNLVTPEDFQDFPPRRPTAGHKGTFGHLAIVAGSLGYHGAAVLAARGAQRAQPGLITLFTPEAVYTPVACQLQAVMVHPVSKDLPLPASCTGIVIGPGLAAANLPDQLQAVVQRFWRDSPLPVIVDASALAWLPEGPCANALRVITPHPGEAARMLQVTTREVQRDRAQAVHELSRRWGHCHVLLKGSQSMIGRHGESLFINNSGNPFLGQGGSGDLLAGYLGGLMAQPQLQKDPRLTLCFGVWQHGACADSLLAAKPNFTVEDLAVELGRARLDQNRAG
jgi:ADP-dependent NAD(P)H-hydrate dehydratase / NAD(P)H-hydrate epimerase